MAVLPNLRKAEAVSPHPYIDTPEFAYDQWLKDNPDGIGVFKGGPTPNIAIIGGGVSGLCAAYELMRTGTCYVTVFEQGATVGGRCASDKFPADSTDIAEMGSMRFPPSEFILSHYLKAPIGVGGKPIVPGGLDALPDFPDPGVLPTYVCYGGETVEWTDPKKPPAGFEKVAKGFNDFAHCGLWSKTTKQLVLQGVPAITQALIDGDVPKAKKLWQDYLNAFGQKSFYQGLYEIFSGTGDYIIPGGIVFGHDNKCPNSAPEPGPAWDFQDFDKFGALGLGSGGFGPLYPIGFTEIFRLLVDGLETKQKFLQPSPTLTDGIRTLAKRFEAKLRDAGQLVYVNTFVDSIRRVSSGFEIWGAPTKGGGQFGPLKSPIGYTFDRVIVATTTRTMELLLGITKYGPNKFVEPNVAQAIMRTHIVSSNKVAALINNFWSYGAPKSKFRCLQTDGFAHQVYTLDYTPEGQPPHRHGVCFITYVWDDDAVKFQSLSNGLPNNPPGQTAAGTFLYYSLLGQIKAIPSKNDEVAKWADLLQPVASRLPNFDVIFQEWQSSPFFSGAFKLSQPGQDRYTHDMFFDYQKAGTSHDSGVYIAGDCITWTSGWVEGALTAGLNAAAGVITSLAGPPYDGQLYPDKKGMTPMKINSKLYNYWGPKKD